MKLKNGRQRRKKVVYALQITWIVSAIIATIVLLVAGNKLLGIDKASEAVSQGTVSATEQEETPSREEEVAAEDTKETDANQSEEEAAKEDENAVKEPSSEPGETLDDETASNETLDDETTDDKNSDQVADGTQDAGQNEDKQPAKEDANGEEQAADLDEKAQAIIAKNNIDVNKPMVALTFDDGPYPKVTNRILQALSDNGGRATFFVMGNRMDSYGDTVEKAYEQGNQIGNHTYSHKDLTKISIEELQYEVGHACELIQEHANEEQVVLRPPYGNRNDTVSENLTVPMIAWSLDTEDWKSRNAQSVIENVLSTVKDGDIILMHDLYESTAEAIEYLVPELIKRGYQLVTIDELFAAKGYTMEAGKVYHNGRGQ